MTGIKTFEIRWADPAGNEIRDTVLALDEKSAVNAYRRIRPETEGIRVSCELIKGEKPRKRRA